MAPKAWAGLIHEPDDLLIELLKEAVENQCGLSPDVQQVKEFLDCVAENATSYSEVRPPALFASRARIKPKSNRASGSADVTGTRPISLTFLGCPYPVTSWADLYSQFLSALAREHPHDIERCCTLEEPKRMYFPRARTNPAPQKYRELPPTGLFYLTDTNTKEKRKLINELLELFGYSQEDFFYTLR